MNTSHPATTTRRILTLVVSAALLGACASTSRTEGTGEYIEDSLITASVKAAVLGERNLNSAEINVETFKGKVQLSGFVSTQSDIDRAVRVARGIKGVTAVTNSMRLK